MRGDRSELDLVARGIIDANAYLTLGTADGSGRPWVSPVYFACDDYTDFYWISAPDAHHSRNIAVRPDVAIVVFDSRIAIGEGQAVYAAATAEALDGEALEEGIRIYSERSVAHGVRSWTVGDVRPPRPYRLYRARATTHWVVDPDASPNRRLRVSPGSRRG